jgi:mono/diheme cytochrome c family protein
MSPNAAKRSTSGELEHALARAGRHCRRGGTSLPLLALVALVALAALSASACELFEPKDPGERVFRKLCASCHGVDGRGNTARYMSNEWADLSDESWKGYGDDGSLETIIREGIFGKMPAHDEISREEMRALLAYLRELRGETAE